MKGDDTKKEKENKEDIIYMRDDNGEEAGTGRRKKKTGMEGEGIGEIENMYI